MQDRSPMIQSISAVASNYTYAPPVRQKAYDLLRQLTGVSTSTSSGSGAEK